MISPASMVRAAAAAYTNTAPTWTGFGAEQSIQVCLTEEDDTAVVAVRGSGTPLEWALDFWVLAARDTEQHDHPSLGWLHGGFYAAALSVINKIALAVHGRRYVIVGHSLGGSVGFTIGALLADDGNPPQAMYGFAPARVGFDRFVACCDKIGAQAWRFGNDPVPVVPLMPYQQVTNLITVGQPMRDPFACHHVGNYVDALTAPGA